MTSITVVGGSSRLVRRISAAPESAVIAVEAVDGGLGTDMMRQLLSHPDDRMPELLVLGDDIEIDAALAIAQSIDRDFPSTTMMLVAEPHQDLVSRALEYGVRDIVPPGIADGDLNSAIERAASGSPLDASERGVEPLQPPPRGRFIVVASPKGGVGKSTVAASLAVLLAAQKPLQTVLVDLDMQFGDVVTLLDLSPAHTVSDAASSGTHDSMLLKTFLTPHPSGLLVLAGAESPLAGDAVSGEQASEVLEVLVSQFSTIVVDTASGLTDHTLAALEVADDIVLVSSMDLTSIRALRKEGEMLDILGLTSAARHVVLNFSDRRSGLTANDVEKVIGSSIDVILPRSVDVPLAGNQGVPMVLRKKPGDFGKPLMGFARTIAPPVPVGRRGKRSKEKRA